jgi:hypothetical protein
MWASNSSFPAAGRENVAQPVGILTIADSQGERAVLMKTAIGVR